MKANQRRQRILDYLVEMQEPVSASRLAQILGVSRQVIVGDVALLRAENHDIVATHRGYLLAERLLPSQSQYLGKVVCRHDVHRVKEEMTLITDLGGRILDVQIDHPFYGILQAPLNIATQADINQFLKDLTQYQDSLLSQLTDGIHLHTIACQDEKQFQLIFKKLEEQGFIYPN